MIQDTLTDIQLQMVEDESGQKMQEFWGAVYGCDHWHFLQQIPPDGSTPEGPPPFGHPNPACVKIEDKLFVLAFTSEERAVDFANENGFVHPELGVPTLKQDTPTAASLLGSIQNDEVFGVLFNHNEGMQGAYAPVGNIATMYEWHNDDLPEGMFDAFVRGVLAAQSPMALERLRTRIVALSQWFFIGDKEHPQTPQLFAHQEDVYPLVFTTEDQAAKGAGASGAEYADNSVPLIASSPEQAIGYLQKVAGESEGKIRAALFNLGTQPFAFAIVDLVAGEKPEES